MTTGRSPESVPARAPSVAAPSSTGGALAGALVALREATAATRFALDIPGAEGARESGAELVRQLDDYVLPRLRRLDAPLLTVVGGSTGAGKSTVVNSLVREQVTPAGVLRPTTRSPVLVCHPDDLRWFSDTRVLPELTRTSHSTCGSPPCSAAALPHRTSVGGSSTDHRTLQLVTSASLDPGLAFLDAPDIDSVVTANRRLATQLLAAADLWLFVTTAARYADAVPWDVLQTAQERGTALAMLLDRVPLGAEDDIAAHLQEMLAAHGLAGAPLFVVPETTLHDGLLPDPVVAPLRGWFSDLARDAAHRAAVVRRTLDGALDSLRPRTAGLAAQARAQVDAAARLRADAHAAYVGAVADVDEGMRDGSLLRGEVLARWQEFVGTGELLRTLQDRVGRLRDRLTAAITGRPQPGTELTAALESGVALLVDAAAERAAERAATSWRTSAAGTALLRDHRRAARPLVAEPARRHRAHRARLAGRGARPGPPGGRVPPDERPDRGVRGERDRPDRHDRGVRQHRVHPHRRRGRGRRRHDGAVPEGARSAVRRPGRPAAGRRGPRRAARAGRRPARLARSPGSSTCSPRTPPIPATPRRWSARRPRSRRPGDAPARAARRAHRRRRGDRRRAAACPGPHRRTRRGPARRRAARPRPGAVAARR